MHMRLGRHWSLLATIPPSYGRNSYIYSAYNQTDPTLRFSHRIPAIIFGPCTKSSSECYSSRAFRDSSGDMEAGGGSW